ncbi:MAG TPA: ATP-dependent DNA helicase RecG, partial [Pseudomonadales bacterium]|nr:ATP-dependent DNA helicase RecG [Pseudomonadales bacterium]
MDESGPALERANVNTLKGVGPQLAAKLEKLGIRTLADVLFHLPLRYEDRTRITPIGHARIGEQVVLEGEVISCEVAFGRRRSLLAYLKDATGVIALRFYHFSKAQQTNLQGAKHITCFGEVRRGAAGLELYHPEYTMGGGPVDEYLTPVYPATEGVTQQRYRKLVGQVLDMMAHGLVLQDFLGGIVRAPQLAYGLNDAVKLMHRPPPDADIDKLLEGTHAAQARLAFEELLAHHTSMRLVREEIAGLISWPMQAPGDAYSELRDNLGFELTRAQRKAGA